MAEDDLMGNIDSIAITIAVRNVQPPNAILTAFLSLIFALVIAHNMVLKW